ncbi:hypothetical protein JTE90_013110 [Oedothorax gibbosus]|uniref:Secreted protein n=1 Tax=Oedothorax gibbosus TaxID=931172 RepID=A0AAV6U502_9ARAC|nr:hypothetical protein JTE90_013110 [Oedothorax gibbosus]
MRWVVLVLSFCLLTSDAAPLVVLYLPIGGGGNRLGGGVIRLVGGVSRLVRGVRTVRVVFRVGSFLTRFALARRLLGRLTRRVSLLAPIFMMHRELRTRLTRGDLKCPGKPLGCNSHDIVV